MTEPKDYTGAGWELLAKAFVELDQGDLRQASEKGWGAAAQMVKAVGQHRGWPHDGHAALFQVVRRLTDESGDNELVRLFQIANSLHINFYEDWIPRASVFESLRAVGELVNKLEPFST